LTKWIEGLNPKLRGKLAKIGLLDAGKIAALRPLVEHVDGAADAPGWKQYLTAKGNTVGHVKLFVNRLRRVFDGCRAVYWSDVSATKLMTWLNEQRSDEVGAKGKILRRGIGAATFNGYVTALIGFGRWMVREGRASENPMVGLRKLNAKTDPRHQRRAFTVDELRWLLDTTSKGPVRGGMTGGERAMLYRVATETGLRSNELASLTRASFMLDGERLGVTVQAGYSKRRRDDVLPLRGDTAADLREFLSTKLPGAKAFNMPPGYDVVDKLLRPDLDDARQAWLGDAATPLDREKREASSFLCYVDAAGRFADFHALRHTTGTLLAASGAHPKIAQSVMRHSSIELTMSRYTHVFAGQESAAVAALPDIVAAPTRQRARATGTDNATAVGASNATGTNNAAIASTDKGTAKDANSVSVTAMGAGYSQASTLAPTAAGIEENGDSVLAMRLALPGGKSRILANRNGLNHMDATDAKTPANIEKSQRLQGILSKTVLREVGLEPTTYALKVRCSTN